MVCRINSIRRRTGGDTSLSAMVCSILVTWTISFIQASLILEESTTIIRTDTEVGAGAERGVRGSVFLKEEAGAWTGSLIRAAVIPIISLHLGPRDRTAEVGVEGRLVGAGIEDR